MNMKSLQKKDELNNKPSEEAIVETSEEAIEETNEKPNEKPNEEENNITVDISNLDLEDFKEHETNSENIITDNLSLEEMKDEIKEEYDDKNSKEDVKIENSVLNIDEESSLENNEVNLEDCEVDFDFSSTDKEEIKLKNPKDVYIEIYKAARKKAKETREKAAQAFLEANNIKKKYNLTEIFESDEEDEENSYLSNF